MAETTTPPTTPPPPATDARTGKAKGPHFKSVSFVIEMADEKCRNFQWPPDKRKLRGRWSLHKAGGWDVADSLREMPDLPGMRVVLKSGSGAIVDPLNEVKNKALVAKAARVIQATFGVKQGPEKDFFLKDMTPAEVKCWCWWARRFVDNRQAEVLAGTLPTADEILAMDGVIDFENFNQGQDADRKKQPTRYVPKRFAEEEATA